VTDASGCVTIRPEAATDAPAIHELLAHAFETPAEANLVDRLRQDGDLVLALVATGAAHAVLGHVAFPRLRVESAGREFPVVGLAPLAVAAKHRRQGIGAALTRAGLDRLRALGEPLVFVMGNPANYTRFGFAVETARSFTSVYAGPHFMALRLADGAPSAGAVHYPAAFDGLA
jgi:putative acetyltransferase